MSKHTAIRRSTLVSSIAMLLVAVMALSGATYAWFSSSNSANATGLKMTATSASGLYIAEDTDKSNTDPSQIAASAYSSTITWSEIANPFVPVSGTATGGTGATFVKTITDKNDGTYNNATIDAATYGTDYIVKKVWVKADTTDSISVKIVPTVTGNVKGYERVAISTQETINTPTIFGAEGEAGYFPLLSGGQSESSVTPTKYSDGVTITGTFDTAKLVYIFVWFEGQDTDCKNLNSGADMEVSINFTKI